MGYKYFSQNKWLAGVTAVVTLSLACALQADSKIHQFNIASQDVGPALMALGEEAGVEIVLTQEVGRSTKLAGIAGEYTLNGALEKMLEGTGLVYEFVSDESVVIRKINDDNDTVRSVSPNSDKVLEEMVVTAEKRAESVQNIPIAISAFSGETLMEAGVTGIKNLKLVAPSVQFGQHNGGNNFVSIRGIGTILRNIGAESGVTVSQDGMPFMQTLTLDFDFFDVERVEVLRGPQGTISGRNATGGAINIYSKRPTEEFTAGLEVTTGNYSRFETEGYLSGPILGDKLLGRLAVRTQRANGWLTNTFLDEEFFGADLTQFKGSLVAQLTDDFEAHLVFERLIDRERRTIGVELGRGRLDQPSLSELYGVPGFDWEAFTFQANFPQDSRVENHKGTLILSWDLGSSANITATTGYMSHEVPYSTFDFDGTLVEWSQFPFFELDIEQFSQELTLTADLTDRLDMILGAIYMQNSAEEPLGLGLPYLGLPTGSIQGFPEQDTTSYALYTQWRYRLTDDLRVTLGARYTYDTKDYIESGIIFGSVTAAVSETKSWSAFTPRLAVDYTLTEDATLYASVSRGFKAGGFNTFGVLADGPNDFAPEFVWNYEGGIKADWLDGRVRTELTGFYTDYEDLQNDVFLVPEGGSFPITVVRNAGAATIKGVEAVMNGQVTDQLYITFSGTWLDAEYKELRSIDPVFPEFGELSLAGNRLPRAPEFQFAVSGEYIAPLSDELQAIFRADYQWQDNVFFDFFNHDVNVQNAYGLLNLSVAIETVDSRWSVSAFARNVLDKRYLYGAEIFETTAAIGPFAGVPAKQLFGQVGEPRMYGVTLAYTF